MKPSPVLLSLAACGFFPAIGQVVHINPSPGLVVTSGSAGPNMFGSRYRLSNSDWDMAITSNSNPNNPPNNLVTANLGTLAQANNAAGTFTLIHRSGTAELGGGFSWTLQFGSSPPASATVLWGDPAQFSATPPVPVTSDPSAFNSILAWRASSSGEITGVQANQAGRAINIMTLSAQASSGDTGSSASLSNVAFTWNDSGSLSTVGHYNNANVVSPASSVTQTLYFSPPGGSGSLLDYNWTLTGNVTLNRLAGVDNSVAINFTGFQQSFTVVPEPEEYLAMLGGVSLLGAWFIRRRNSRDCRLK